MTDGAVRLLGGCMSGTSADGSDVALLSVTGPPSDPKRQLLGHHFTPFEEGLRGRILEAVRPQGTDSSGVARLHVELGEFFAAAIHRACTLAGIEPHTLTAVGLHGQTIHHAPRWEWPVTFQIGSPAVVAERLGCPVVNDFRSRDVAAGGEGAPLTAFTDAVLLRSVSEERIVVNIGGITNITWLPAGAGTDGVAGFDTGPGNMVMDALIRLGTGGRDQMDRDGRLASAGEPIEELLAEWKAHPFFGRLPPRTAGREEFGEGFTQEALSRWGARRPLADLVATAAGLTIWSIDRAIHEHLPDAAGGRRVLLCGGGARNVWLREQLTDRLAPVTVGVTDEAGVPAAAREAIAFALLADAFLQGVPAGLPAATGASGPRILGSWTPGRAPAPPPLARADS